MLDIEELIKTLEISRGKKVRYYMTIEYNNKKYGLGFDDAHFWDALHDLEDKSYYDDVQKTAIEMIMRHNYID